MDKWHDVIVVGAGWAGVAAAAELERREPSLDCIVLEASSRIGGRALTMLRADGSVVDLGAHYFGKMHTRLFEIAKSLAAEGIYDRLSVYGDDPGFRAFLDGRWVITTRKNSSLHDWIERQDLPQALRDMWNLAAIGIQSADPTHISLLYFFWYHATSGGFMVTANDWEGSPQQYSIRCGIGGLLERYAGELATPLLTNSAVARIVAVNGGHRVECGDGRSFTARHVIIAGSPHAIGRSIEFTPEISPERRAILNQRPGHAAKAVFVYDEPFWRSSFGVHFYGYFGGVRTEGLEWSLDTSDPDASSYSLMFFVSPVLASRLEAESDPAARRAMLSAAVVEATGDARAASFSHVDTFRWESREYVWGAPNTTYAPNVLSRVGSAFHAPDGPEGRLHFACAEASTEFTGYVEGAIRSGETCAARVHRALLAERRGVPVDRSPLPPVKDRRRLRYLKSAGAFVGAKMLSIPIAILDRFRPAPVSTPPARGTAD